MPHGLVEPQPVQHAFPAQGQLKLWLGSGVGGRGKRPPPGGHSVKRADAPDMLANGPASTKYVERGLPKKSVSVPGPPAGEAARSGASSLVMSRYKSDANVHIAPVLEPM